MIRGIGMDIIEIGSIRKSMEQSDRFTRRLFTENEIRDCEDKPDKYQHYAARFAAKEAFMKTIKTGWNDGIQWKQIEVMNRPGGVPEVCATGKAKERMDKIGVTHVEISLSHSVLFG